MRPDRSGETIEDAHRIAVRVMWSLQASLDKLATLMPLNAAWLAAAGPDDLEQIDAFLKRFANLVEAGRRLHRAAIVQAAEGESTMAAQEINQRLETLNLLTSADRWYQVIGARNATTHEYAADFDITAEAITEAFDAAKIALEMVRFTLTEVRRRFPESSPELQWP